MKIAKVAVDVLEVPVEDAYVAAGRAVEANWHIVARITTDDGASLDEFPTVTETTEDQAATDQLEGAALEAQEPLPEGVPERLPPLQLAGWWSTFAGVSLATAGGVSAMRCAISSTRASRSSGAKAWFTRPTRAASSPVYSRPARCSSMA